MIDAPRGKRIAQQQNVARLLASIVL